MIHSLSKPFKKEEEYYSEISKKEKEHYKKLRKAHLKHLKKCHHCDHDFYHNDDYYYRDGVYYSRTTRAPVNVDAEVVFRNGAIRVAF